MKELSILFVDSVNESLIKNFKDQDQIKDFFELNKFEASNKEMLLVPKLYLKNEIDTILVTINDSLNKNELCELGSQVRNIIPFDCHVSYLFNLENEVDIQEFTLGLILSGYKFQKYIETDSKEINIKFDESIDIDEQKFLKDSIYFVRDLVNLPALDSLKIFLISFFFPSRSIISILVFFFIFDFIVNLNGL